MTDKELALATELHDKAYRAQYERSNFQKLMDSDYITISSAQIDGILISSICKDPDYQDLIAATRIALTIIDIALAEYAKKKRLAFENYHNEVQ